MTAKPSEQSIERLAIPVLWKDLMFDEFKTDLNKAIDIDEVRFKLRYRWKWLIMEMSPIEETINILHYNFPAMRISELVTWKLIDEGKDLGLGHNETSGIRMRFARAIEVLVKMGFVRQIKITSEEAGKGKRGVSIYASTFATDEEIEKARRAYLDKGGDLPKAVKKTKVTPEEIAEHNQQVIEVTAVKKRKSRAKKVKPLTCQKCNTDYPTGQKICDTCHPVVRLVEKKMNGAVSDYF